MVSVKKTIGCRGDVCSLVNMVEPDPLIIFPILSAADKPYLSLNGAIMHFRQHSPYLCEAFHIMSTSPRPPPNTLTWGAFLYQKLYHRLLANQIIPFGVLPWCFADPRNCRDNIRFPDPFEDDPKFWHGLPWISTDGEAVNSGAKEELERRVGQIWSIHLHNQWGKSFPKDGWVNRLLDGYDVQLEALELYDRMGSGREQKRT
jgi:hypothetical protein